MNARTTVFALVAVLGTAGLALAVPEVTNVRMQQRINSRIVDVWYDLASEAAIVTLSIETNSVPIPDNAVTRLTGDVSVVIQPGTNKHIVWNAGADWPEHVAENTKARVTAWSTNAPPRVLVIDLSKGTAATASDPYPVYYCTSLDALPGGGLSNMVYRNSCLVMRKISMSEPPYGVFNMGDSGSEILTTLTRDFYAGVFEVTQGQWVKVMGNNPSYFVDATSQMIRPVDQTSYDSIRGSSAEGGGGWPTNTSVYANSFVGRIRSRSGLSTLDLPTEAQWEYACRAGTTTYYNDGLGTPANTTSNPQMNVLGRYAYNGGKINGTTDAPTGCGPTNGSAVVGSYLPNAWGLYDMHGNAWETCLDWKGTLPEGGIDPDGPDSGSQRVRRSGSLGNPALDCRTASRAGAGTGYADKNMGFRLFRSLP